MRRRAVGEQLLAAAEHDRQREDAHRVDQVIGEQRVDELGTALGDQGRAALLLQALWWRKYASAASATLVGTSTGTYQGTTSTAGSFTLTVDRCENFTLTLKVWSTDNQFKSDDHAVTIGSCPPPPPPPLSVTINGPGGITTKATYTYTAVTSGFTSPSYAWSQRFCTSGSCPAWTTLTGFTTSVGRVLGPDCSGTGNNWYEIKVVVRNSDARTATATRQTGLCGGLN